MNCGWIVSTRPAEIHTVESQLVLFSGASLRASLVPWITESVGECFNCATAAWRGQQPIWLIPSRVWTTRSLGGNEERCGVAHRGSSLGFSFRWKSKRALKSGPALNDKLLLDRARYDPAHPPAAKTNLRSPTPSEAIKPPSLLRHWNAN